MHSLPPSHCKSPEVRGDAQRYSTVAVCWNMDAARRLIHVHAFHAYALLLLIPQVLT
jgi:hypothetical protein